MTPQQTYLWRFDQPLREHSRILCPSCSVASDLSLWTQGEVECDLCGSHLAMKCPECEEEFDHVWSDTFEVKEP